MTKKQAAVIVGPVLVALAAALSQCPDDAPAPRPEPPAKHSADAGTRRPPLDAGKR